MVNKNIRIEEINKNYEWFNKHREEILKENPQKNGYYVVLVNCKIKGLYKTYKEAQKNAPDNGLYSIQRLENNNIVNMMGFFSLNG
ncbi:hypothetical protein SKUN_00623 [Spiroplasma kunkelii CR2-3x]|uniref:Uncharacterized protein n=1 Tax=Spiroplasma kunkelii CR2-3x TaxID=273035 RepID=A0A0K2JGZ8_SPIKU|nr:hypothetical protein [Spiroplasma kunkelii]ALA97516.1 hypothetical protein SKUN_00623 [Spiroplasma kunkelii CR2-3x]